MLKTCFKREESKHFIYRHYKHFNDISFPMDLENKLEECPKHYQNFEKTFVNVLDAHAARKTNVLRSNHKSHVDKNLRKAIIKLNLKTKQIELNFKMILLNIRKHRENIKT